MKNFVQKLTRAAWLAMIALLGAAATRQDRILPELPEATTPVRLAAVSDPLTGQSAFRYAGNNIPPVIRVQPGSTLNVEYTNHLAVQSKKSVLTFRA